MNESGPCWLVELEFKRVQTYLFAVPELKAMIGANALIGEILRGRVTPKGFGSPDSLPGLAVECGARLPGGTALEASAVPGGDADDPLKGEPHQDDPHAAFGQGILSRDGGHLHVTFTDKDHAAEFVRRARDLVGRRLPGLLLNAHILELTKGEKGWQRPDKKTDRAGSGAERKGEELADLPQFQVCMVTGQGPAGEERVQDGRRIRLSASVKARREEAKQFDQGKSGDVLGLMRRHLVATFGLDGLPSETREELFPREFSEVVQSGYLAVIHADGNCMGSRSMDWRKTAPSEDFFVREGHGEKFFHAMRLAVRKSLVAALQRVFEAAAKRIVQAGRGRLPFRLMMLGGDDLLLVCNAAYAMPLVIHYTQALQGHVLPGGAPLDVGIGVAVVKDKFPFHRAYALADQLASSAKRQDRARSMVDWLSLSEAWHEDVALVRQRDFCKRYARTAKETQRETLLLSRRPYPVLGKAMSLEALWQAALGAASAVAPLPRSQLMGLADQLERGRLHAEEAVRQLKDSHRSLLQAALVDGSPWQELRPQMFATALLDFLELFELARQWRGLEPPATSGGPSDG